MEEDNITNEPGSESFIHLPSLKQLVKALAIIVFVLTSLALIYFSPLKDYLHEVGRVQDTLERTGNWAPPLFVVVTAILVCLGVPRLLICPIGGAVFGFVWGLFLTQLGTLLGSYSTFLFVRWGGREWVVSRWPRLLELTAVFERRGMAAVFLARQLPVGGIFVNMILALTPVRHGAFLLGTLLGILPEAIPATLLGAGTIEMMGDKGMWKTVLAVVTLVVVWLCFAEYLRRSKMASSFLRRAKRLLGKKGSIPDEG
jgi:uncharacterized membrane protein YdjX (TVP38/TMEM64 family)